MKRTKIAASEAGRKKQPTLSTVRLASPPPPKKARIEVTITNKSARPKSPHKSVVARVCDGFAAALGFNRKASLSIPAQKTTDQKKEHYLQRWKERLSCKTSKSSSTSKSSKKVRHLSCVKYVCVFFLLQQLPAVKEVYSTVVKRKAESPPSMERVRELAHKKNLLTTGLNRLLHRRRSHSPSRSPRRQYKTLKPLKLNSSNGRPSKPFVSSYTRPNDCHRPVSPVRKVGASTHCSHRFLQHKQVSSIVPAIAHPLTILASSCRKLKEPELLDYTNLLHAPMFGKQADEAVDADHRINMCNVTVRATKARWVHRVRVVLVYIAQI
jgi:hypothetical protein